MFGQPECPVECNLTVAVQDSGMVAALGYVSCAIRPSRPSPMGASLACRKAMVSTDLPIAIPEGTYA
ncbi:hypothetical protein SUGI_0654300 [Cryptomeria japonica]|nr:hypothetical protein SUGI_0654300 [Cryptomeria japonica]